MICQKCGAPCPEGAILCMRCQPRTVGPVAPGPKTDTADDPFMRFVVPMKTSPWAIAAGYVGLFAILVLPAPLALFFALMAVRDLKRNPLKHGWGRTILGLVTGGLGTLLLIFVITMLLVEWSTAKPSQ